MEIKKIIVGTDFSVESETAVDHAMNVARHCGAEIVLVHATTMPAVDLPEQCQGIVDHPDVRLEDEYKHEHGQLAALRQRYIGRGVTISQLMVNDIPGEAVPRAAEETGADLVVVGTHGLTGFKRFLLGSVAETVVRSTETNVLVARKGADGAGGYKKILVPTDFSDIAHKALHMAMHVAADGAEIELFHSWSLPATASGRGIPGAETVGQRLRQQITADAEAKIKQVIAEHKDANVKLVFHHLEHAATHGVQRRLEEGKFDICVMGSHGRRGLRRFILGSVAEMTVRYAPCSVLVVHGKYVGND